MTVQDLLDEFAVKIYSSPLADLRTSGAIRDLANPIHVAMLLIDFETEVSMNGINDFIGNSSGQYLSETIDALAQIGRHTDAGFLRQISLVAADAGMTHGAIQAERSDVPEYTVTSWTEMHGDKWDVACRLNRELCDNIDFSGVIEGVTELVERNAEVFRQALRPGRV
jgi:hypothetical protein